MVPVTSLTKHRGNLRRQLPFSRGYLGNICGKHRLLLKEAILEKQQRQNRLAAPKLLDIEAVPGDSMLIVYILWLPATMLMDTRSTAALTQLTTGNCNHRDKACQRRRVPSDRLQSPASPWEACLLQSGALQQRGVWASHSGGRNTAAAYGHLSRLSWQRGKGRGA